MSADRKVVQKSTMIECLQKMQLLSLLEAIDKHKVSCMCLLTVVLVLLTSCSIFICVVYCLRGSHQYQVYQFYLRIKYSYY
jgi:hypothetical protein